MNYFECLANVEQRAKKCIELRGYYVECNTSLVTVVVRFLVEMRT